MKKRNCKKGYSCGRSCINVKLECLKGLTGQSVNIVEKLSALIAAASPPGISSDGFDKKLGHGAFGSVYSNGRGQALKVIPPNDILAAGILENNIKNSVNIQNKMAEVGFAPKVLDYEVNNNSDTKILMEELQGYSRLQDYIQDDGTSKPVSQAQHDAIINNVDKASEAFAANKIAHNDIKGVNVMVNDLGDIKVIDYDFAEVMDVSDSRMERISKSDFRLLKQSLRYLKVPAE